MRPLATVLFALLATAPALAQGPGKAAVDETGSWAVVVDGRAKPLQTFARETVRAITGRTGCDGLSPLEILWGYHFAAADFRTREYVRVDGLEIKAALEMGPEQRRSSFDALLNHSEFQRIAGAAVEKERAGQKLSQLEREALAVYGKLAVVMELIEGRSLALVPRPDETGPWSAPDSLKNAADEAGQRVYAGFVKLAQAYAAADPVAFGSQAALLRRDLRAVDPGLYPSEAALACEVFHNDFGAFHKGWILYLFSFVLLAIAAARAGQGKGGRLRWAGLLLLSLGFAAHTLGIVLRWLIAGRAPVSDMYESLVFMGWGVIAIGLVLEVLSRRAAFGLAAAFMGFLALLFAENLPLDSSINPLAPVLADTSWLSIHVMTIMLSYSAFALAMAMGHVVLFLQLFRPGRTQQLRTHAALLYKTLQVGVLFLVAGIAFGAIWANESWGRYWGWDPKETWSLITMFAYMVVVHARFAGWLQHFGLAVSSILAFLAVIMTYYGVNYVLASGLHSYGFSEGGVPWVLGYLGCEALVILLAFQRYRSAVRAGRILLPQRA